MYCDIQSFIQAYFTQEVYDHYIIQVVLRNSHFTTHFASVLFLYFIYSSLSNIYTYCGFDHSTHVPLNNM